MTSRQIKPSNDDHLIRTEPLFARDFIAEFFMISSVDNERKAAFYPAAGYISKTTYLSVPGVVPSGVLVGGLVAEDMVVTECKSICLVIADVD